MRRIPIFIPHLGCPNACVFCNQRRISGTLSFCEEDVPALIETALASIEASRDEKMLLSDKNHINVSRETLQKDTLSEQKREKGVEIAFFGGSFTAIDRDLMLRLLETAQGYVRAGRVDGIRLSTRPDAVDEDILRILRRYTVTTVELGIQSMDDAVLRAARRGHTAEDSVRACRLVTAYGFSLVGQMMIGLPGSTVAEESDTARAICALGADAARIYPTAVFEGTELAARWRAGAYTPLTPEDAVERSCAALRIFRERRVSVIRVGLCEGEGLNGPDGIVAGIHHPAFGELCEGRLWRDRLAAYLAAHPTDAGERTLRVPERCLSQAIGQKGDNRRWLTEQFGLRCLRIRGDPALGGEEIGE